MNKKQIIKAIKIFNHQGDLAKLLNISTSEMNRISLSGKLKPELEKDFLESMKSRQHVIYDAIKLLQNGTPIAMINIPLPFKDLLKALGVNSNKYYHMEKNLIEHDRKTVVKVIKLLQNNHDFLGRLG